MLSLMQASRDWENELIIQLIMYPDQEDIGTWEKIDVPCGNKLVIVAAAYNQIRSSVD